MKKTAYILGSIEIILGMLLLCAHSMIQNVMPVLGRMAYQAAAAGSYSPRDYEVSMPLVIIAAVVLVLAGIVQMIHFAARKPDGE